MLYIILNNLSMDWILLENEPLHKIMTQLEKNEEKIEQLTNKITELEKNNQNLENFMISNQKLFLKQFSVICDILQENRRIYMNQFKSEKKQISSLKPILNDIKKSREEPESENFMIRVNNMLWRSTNKNANDISGISLTKK